MRILALSKHDLRYPFHGAARLQLGLVSALSSSVETLYIKSGFSKDYVVKIATTDYNNFNSHFIQLSIPISIDNIKRLTNKMHFTPDIIFCLSRDHYLHCMILAKIFRDPLILLNDAMRYLYLNEIIKSGGSVTFRLREASIGMIAIPYYIMLTSLSNLPIAVSKDIIEKMRLLKNKIVCLRPPFILLKDKPSLDHNIIPVNSILYSGDIETLIKLIEIFKELNFIVTGPMAFHIKSILYSKNNLFLLHNISDADLVKLHEKIKFAIVLRNSMTGISMTILQELFFGKPIIANNIATRGFEDFIGRGIYIARNLDELKILIKKLNNEAKNNDLSELIREQYMLKLSPYKFTLKLMKYLNWLS
jgi:hypothetical protein